MPLKVMVTPLSRSVGSTKPTYLKQYSGGVVDFSSSTEGLVLDRSRCSSHTHTKQSHST